MARDWQTLDLLAWEPPKVAAGFEPDKLPGSRISSRISRAVGLALRECGRTRSDVAAAMSADLGYPISTDMLDAYASEAKEGHRITVDRFVALIAATGCVDLLGVIAEPFDHVAVPKRFEALIELHLIDEHERDVARRKQAAEAKWRASR